MILSIPVIERARSFVLRTGAVFIAAVLSLLLWIGESQAEKAKIYVIREADGVIRFTTKEPPKGVKASIFTSSGGGFSSYRIKGVSSSQIYPDRFNSIISVASREHQVEAGLIKAVIHVESAFNPSARSSKGAQGLMQLMPGTAKELGVRNAWSPASNISGGTKHLARLIRRYEGNVHYALAAYNAGEQAVSRYNGVPPFSETQDYVRRVLQLKKRYSAVSHG
jgi:soluble lytic murein transglycosylase-like protein